MRIINSNFNDRLVNESDAIIVIEMTKELNLSEVLNTCVR